MGSCTPIDKVPSKDVPAVDQKSIEIGLSDSSSSSTTDVAKRATQNNTFGVDDVFQDEQMAQFYQPCDEYEGKHRFDPAAQWTDAEEKKLIRKLDWKICSFCCLMFFALQLDRGNIGQALSDNMLSDLGLTTNHYNTGQTIFYVSFLLAELPSQLISKAIGPDNWIPIQMVSWSIVAICQCRLTGVAGFYVTRSLLGLIEGGFIPDVVLYLTYFYKGKELPVRLAFFWTSQAGTGIVAAFMAYGILRLRGYGGWEGWRWLFALEGGLTALIGIFAWFYLPPSPTQTASWFRGKDGWFDEREETIMVTRILRDDPSKGDMHNRQHIRLSEMWASLKDYDMWPIYLIGVTWLMPSGPVAQYLTLTLRSVGFNTFQTNLLTIPATSLLIVQGLFWTWFSEKINARLVIGVANAVWLMPLLFALRFLPEGSSPWAWFSISTLVVGHVFVHAILVAITSRNAGSVRTRTIGSALYNMSVQLSSIISSNIYRSDDAPRYRRGNTVLVAVNIFTFFTFIGAILYYRWRNASRDKIWNKMTKEEKEEYLRTTKDSGNKRLDFRFAY